MNLTELKIKSTQHHLVWGDVAHFRFEHFMPTYQSALELSVKDGEKSLIIWDKGCPDWLDPFLTLADKARLKSRHKVTLSKVANGIDLCLAEDFEDNIQENGLKLLRIEFQPNPLLIKSAFITFKKEKASPEALARLLEYCEP